MTGGQRSLLERRAYDSLAPREMSSPQRLAGSSAGLVNSGESVATLCSMPSYGVDQEEVPVTRQSETVGCFFVHHC